MFMSDLVGNPKDRFLHDAAHMQVYHEFKSSSTVLKSLCKKGAPYRIMSYEAYKQQLQWNTKMVYRRTYSNEKATPGHEGVQVGRHERQSSQEQRRVSNHTMSTVEPSMAGKHERQGSEEEKKVSDVTPGKKSDVTPGKLKRPLSQENGEPQTKKLKVSDEV